MTEVSVAEAFERGLLHHRAGRFEQAESVYRQILHAAPAHPDALHLLGLIAHQRGQNDAALELIDAALGARPRHPGYHNDRGRRE
jgi:protein O-GlcNAc transferase